MGQPHATPLGVEVTFVGSGHDDFDDGRFDDWVSLRFRRGNDVEDRIVSLHAPRRAYELFNLCWQLGERTTDGIEVVFMPRAASQQAQP